MNKIVSLFTILLVLPATFAHMYLSSLTLGGTPQGVGDCVRLVGSNSPVVPCTNPDMTCGLRPGADKAANKKCPVAAGSKVGMQWWHNGPGPQDDIVDPSHQGPCIVYMAKDNNDGKPQWFKIWENGFDTTTKKFCVATLIANKGLMEFTIPSDIVAGNYLVRGEIIALHESNRMDGAQFYIGCAELTVSGSGKAEPSTVLLPGAYKSSDPGIYIPNYYSAPVTQYTIPGPAVYTVGNGGKGGSGATGGGGGNEGNGKQNGGASASKGGMSGGGAAALVIVIIAFVAAFAFTAFYYRKNGHVFGKSLPQKYHTQIFKGDSASAPAQDRRAGNYVAFTEEL